MIAAAKRASEGAGEDILDEQEALDQANMWQEIADQSKQEARQGKKYCMNPIVLSAVRE